MQKVPVTFCIPPAVAKVILVFESELLSILGNDLTQLGA